MATGEKLSEKSRRERRKEARLANKKKKFDSWVQHKQSVKLKGSVATNQTQTVNKLESGDGFCKPQRSSRMQPEKADDLEGEYGSAEPPQPSKNARSEKNLKRKKSTNKISKSKFFDYLQMEMEGRVPSAEEDLIIERRLAKKLKVKNGRLQTGIDDLDLLLDGLPSMLDNLGETNKVTSSIGNSVLSGESSENDSLNEELGDEISSNEEDETSANEADELSVDEEDGTSADDKDDGTSADDKDDGISGDEENEESDSLASGHKHDNLGEVISLKYTNKGKKQKTKFEEYLENDLESVKNSAEADFAMERKLAKKLKVKAGKLGGDDDELNMLLEGAPSVLDPVCEPKEKAKIVSSKNKASICLEPSPKAALGNAPSTVGRKYVAPGLRSQNGNETTEHAQVRKQVKGPLNKLAERNVESITAEISTLFHTVGRSIVSQILTEQVVASCSQEQSAAFASFVTGMTCLVGIDFGAKLLECLAKRFEDEYLKEDSLSLRNLTLLLSYLYIFGLCSSELVYDFLTMLGMKLTEVDVSTVKTVLDCCGMKLRGDDPTGMKNFIMNVQSQVSKLKTASEDGRSNLINKRMEFMLETILDIKNNKKRPKEDTVERTRIKKWLQKLRVDGIPIRGLKWSKLIDPNKKGQWWLSGDLPMVTENVEEVAGTIDKEIPETKKMLELAAAQRMNTDSRRAIFCVIMSGEDYVDAFEKILRLDLPGKQDQEIMRVLVECCLQEKVFNKYYCVLASKLCSHSKNHKFTLQCCLWDHFKELESMPLIRSMHLAKFIVEMVASFSLSLAVLKVAGLNDVVCLTPKRIMHFRMLFEAILELQDKLVWNIFTRIAVAPEYEYELLRSGIIFFITKYVVTNQKPFEKKLKLIKKALNNAEGVLM